MDRYEVRFTLERAIKFVKFSTLESAQRFYDKVKSAAAKSNKHGKVAIWKNGWLEYGEEF